MKIILPILQIKKMRLVEVKCPRSHNWSLVRPHHELLAQFLNAALSTFAAINILWGILQFSRHF